MFTIPSIYNVSALDNKRNIEEYALRMAILHDESATEPTGEPDTVKVDRMAKEVLANHDLIVLVAFDVILHMKQKLKTKILHNNTPYRLVSSLDILRIAKHACEVLKVAFKPYSERLKTIEPLKLSELTRRIAGSLHRDAVVNLVTGSGINFTGLVRLYYDHTRLNKIQSLKMMIGLEQSDGAAIYYSESLPKPAQIEVYIASVISEVLK